MVAPVRVGVEHRGMAAANGTQTRKRILVVGGQENSVPAWAEAVFEIDRAACGGGKEKGKLDASPADAIVILTDRVAYDISLQACELGRLWGVPIFRSARGWSAAVAEATRIGATWFVDAVQRGGTMLADKNAPRAAEAAEIVDNAWKATAEYEVERARALERQLAKERERREEVEQLLARVRSGAEQRIVGEIRKRAADVKAHEHERLVPVRKAAADLVRSVRKAQMTMAQALADVDRARDVLNRLLDAERVE